MREFQAQPRRSRHPGSAAVTLWLATGSHSLSATVSSSLSATLSAESVSDTANSNVTVSASVGGSHSLSATGSASVSAYSQCFGGAGVSQCYSQCFGGAGVLAVSASVSATARVCAHMPPCICMTVCIPTYNYTCTHKLHLCNYTHTPKLTVCMCVFVRTVDVLFN